MHEPKFRHRPSPLTKSILIVGLLSLSTAATAMELGRLFFSPNERDLMNRARSAPFSCLSLTGVVLKNGQEHGTWMDWDPMSSRDYKNDEVSIEAINDARITIQVRIIADESVTLRPGQTFDVIRGEVRDAFDTRQRHCTG